MIKVTIWNEYYHEKTEEEVKTLYPNGLHGFIKDFLEQNKDICVKTVTLDDPDCGLTDEVLAQTDVLLWWGHCLHDKVPDSVVERVYQEVLKGMGFIALHSAHHSKIFKKLMGTSCNLSWRSSDRERVWCCKPGHPIAQGIPEYFELPEEEMYGEHFDIPNPDDVIFLGWFAGGEVFRSGCTFSRGNGRIFYFQPGHESHKSYYNKYVQKILTNAVRWAAPTYRTDRLECPQISVSPEKRLKNNLQAV